MKKYVASLIGMAAFLPLFAFGIIASTPQVAQAACNTNGVLGGAQCAKSSQQRSDIGVVIENITNVLLFIIGAVAVIMIIIGGIRYTTSNGDASQVTAAKNTILYGVIGVVIALIAFAVVRFVVTSFMAPAGSSDESSTSATS